MSDDMRAGTQWGVQSTEKERADLARWVVAMRRAHAAGTPQGKEGLRSPSGYCCLGLWCAVCEARGILESRTGGSFSAFDLTEWAAIDGGGWEGANLPLGSWLARSSNPELIRDLLPREYDDPADTVCVNAAEANDEHGLTFAQIADVVTWSYGITPEEIAAAELEPWVPEIEGPERR